MLNSTTANEHSSMVLGLFGYLLKHGGVERAGRLTGAALAHIARAKGQMCCLLSLHDPPGMHSYTVGGLQCSCFGFGNNRLKFVAQALRLSPRVQIAFLGHINLAPIGRAMSVVNPGLRYWVAAHGMEVWEPLKGLRRRGLHRAEVVTAPSRHTASQLVKVQGLHPAKVALLPHCLEPGFADHGSAEDAQQASPSGCILTVGRLLSWEPGKGVDTVLRALPKVLDAFPRVRYFIIGDGDLRPNLERLAEDVGVSGSVIFLGHQSEEDLKHYYLHTDIFVMPSRQEGFGIVFLEAMGFGKPVVAAAFGGATDIVIDGQTGCLVEYGDVDTLADRLISILRDADLRGRLGSAGRKRVETTYTFTHFRQTLAEILCASST
jgi:glycosyltransferase involved in cell wall biosynthesis